MAKTKKRESAIATPERAATPEPAPTPQTAEPAETAPQSAGDTTAAAPDRDRVATRAYELYLGRGGGEGRELDDWLTAEQEVNSKSDDPNRE